MAEGAVEVGANHYPLFVVLHAALAVGAGDLHAVDGRAEPLAVGGLCPAAVRPGLGHRHPRPVLDHADHHPARRALVRNGPFRFVRHPNYWVASLEIAVLPLVFGQIWIAVVFSMLNAILVA